MIEMDGRFWLSKDGKSFLGKGRIELLKQIDSTGSMLGAAKSMKMSYKAAWDTLNQMNELSSLPLLEKSTGGKGGGGTRLTLYARELIGTFEKFDELHKSFMERFKKAGDDPAKLQTILNRTFLTTSARNQFLCKIKDIQEGKVVSTITLSLNQNHIIRSKITTRSMQNMGLKSLQNIYAIIKSSDIKITLLKEQSDDNALEGKVVSIEKSELGAEVHLKIDEDIMLVALIKKDESSELKIGAKAFGIIKKENILIGI